MASTEGRNPYEDYVLINKELEEFNKKLLDKPQIIIANKSDMPEFEDNLKEFKKQVKDIPVFEVSAIKGEGLDKVVDKLSSMLDDIPTVKNTTETTHKEYTYVKEEPFYVEKEDDCWHLYGDKVEEMFKMTKFESDEDIYRFAHRLSKMGVDDKLRELGAEEGDKVRILDFYFDFKD